MPLYFFDVTDGDTRYADDVGTDMSDLSEVRQEALSTLRDFASDRAPEAGTRTYTILARDEAGRAILSAEAVVTLRWLQTTED
ncbi:hypothetical protein [uncultured Jannaschia sp.]|uniref:DUF6894 family protein n=1 Tax=uncultured Jannaschia sp. TaxID=293347 RepID=UPI00262CBC90|nr:hypothetical protein [uncultured Jannaschia sp.]